MYHAARYRLLRHLFICTIFTFYFLLYADENAHGTAGADEGRQRVYFAPSRYLGLILRRYDAIRAPLIDERTDAGANQPALLRYRFNKIPTHADAVYQHDFISAVRCFTFTITF